jgi:HK97 family phage portal protein
MKLFNRKHIPKSEPKKEETYSLPPVYYVTSDPGTGLWDSSNDYLSTDIILSCVSIRCDIMASLPIKIYQTKDNRSVEIDHPLKRILTIPNEYQTDFDFIAYIQKSLDLHGNAYIQKIFNNRNEVVEMIPLNPEGMVINLSDDGRLVYVYDEIPLITEEIIHVKNIGSSIYVGDSTISLLSTTIDTYNYAQSNIKGNHKNGPQLKGVIESSGPIKGDTRTSLENSINSNYTGTNSGKTMILSNGLTWKSIGLSPQDAQTLQSMNWSLERICSVFRIPPAWVYSSTVKPSYSSNEQNTQDFITHAIRPLCKRYESAFNRYLLSEKDRKNGIYIKFDLNSMLRADLNSRYDSYTKAVQWGILSPNECRELENRPPIEGGEKPFMPINHKILGEEDPQTQND